MPSQADKKFATAEEAARAALAEANRLSIRDNREYGGRVYENPDGTFSFTPPQQGGLDTFDLSSVTVPPDATTVADYHTHGDYTYDDGERTSDPSKDDYDSEHFSPQDRNSSANMARGNPNYRSYLGTPSGALREYNPSTGGVRNLN